MNANKKFRVKIDIEIQRGRWCRNIPVGDFRMLDDAQKSMEFIKYHYPRLLPHMPPTIIKGQR